MITGSLIQSSMRRFLRNWANHTRLQVTTLSVLVGTFTLLFIALALFKGLSSSLESYGSNIQMTAYLKDDHKELYKDDLAEVVRKESGVSSVLYVSAEEAIEKFKSKMADHLPEMFFEANFENPLPATLEIELKEELLEKGQEAKIKALADQIKQVPGIEDVSFGFNWASQFSKITRAFTMSGLFLLLILVVGGIFVIGNSVNQSIHQKRDEIEVMELFGATKNSIIIPFVVEGALTGILAGVFSLILSAIAITWLKAVISDEMGFIGVMGDLSPLGFGASMLSILSCALMGGLAAYIFVRRITTGWSAAAGSLS